MRVRAQLNLAAHIPRTVVERSRTYPSQRHCRKYPRLQICRSVALEVDAPAETEGLAVRKRKYVMVSGKGGVGKTSLSAALAVKYASEGHDTLIVSTDPAHSLGDSLGQLLPGGVPVPIEGTDLPIWGMEIDPDKAAADFKVFASTAGKDKVKVCAPGRCQLFCGACAPWR
jgi:hypothetical protein